jgi:thioredoxin-related protein
MRKLFAGFFFALLMSLPLGASRADLDMAAAPENVTYELVVVEADGCIYCKLFRRDVLPAYEASNQGKQAPVRFLDVNDIETASLGLTSAVEIVPTFVVVKSHHEVGRIAGYVGPENFFHSVKYLIASAP